MRNQITLTKNLNIDIDILLITVLILFNLLDFLTTKILINFYGFNVELNPFLNYALHLTQTSYSILFIKLMIMIPPFIGIFYIKKERRYIFRPILRVLTIIFGLVCIYNTIQIYQYIGV